MIKKQIFKSNLNKKEKKPIKDEIVTKPKNKPKEDFNIASMLKRFRNEKSK